MRVAGKANVVERVGYTVYAGVWEGNYVLTYYADRVSRIIKLFRQSIKIKRQPSPGPRGMAL